MDLDHLGTKMRSLDRCVSRLEQRGRSSDPEAQDIIALDLEECVQICLDVASAIISLDSSVPAASSMKGKFEALESMAVLTPEAAEGMRNSIELRNIFLNNCRSADRGTVLSLLESSIGSFKEFAESVSRHTGLVPGSCR